MIHVRARVLAGALLGVSLMARVADATPVTFNFSGIVTQVPIDDLGTGVSPLDSISGSFTFDSAAVDAIAASTSGSYTSNGAAFGMTATIGAHTFAEAGALNVGILNGFVDQYTVHASSSPLLTMDLLFQDNSASAFSTDGLPLSPPPLGGFLQRDFHLDETDIGGNETQIDGAITSLTCAAGCGASTVPAPEPSSLVLLTTGAMFYGRRRWRKMRCLALLASLTAIAAPTYAVDGVVLINQAAALNGNVTAGDAPGFPVTISVPGSYRLSSNLTVPDANTSAIQVVASDVTIDLNGFSIVGPVSCTGFPTTCSPTGAGNGIDALAFADHIKVFNGTIRGMGSNGIHLLGFAHFVDRVHAVGNGRIGILVGGAVNQSNGSDNGSDGIVADSVTASSARGNGGNGIAVSASAIHNDVDTNAQQGIFANCPAVVALNSSGVNAGGSIFTSGAGCVRANNVPAP